MRNSGRTSRIANFAIDQLHSVGEVIITDHIAFEGYDVNIKHLLHLIDKVKDGFERTRYLQDIVVKHETHWIGKTPVIRFKLEIPTQIKRL